MTHITTWNNGRVHDLLLSAPQVRMGMSLCFKGILTMEHINFTIMCWYEYPLLSSVPLLYIPPKAPILLRVRSCFAMSEIGNVTSEINMHKTKVTLIIALYWKL